MEPILVTLYTEYTKLIELHNATGKKINQLAELIKTYRGDPDSIKDLHPDALQQLREDIHDGLYPMESNWQEKIIFMFKKFPETYHEANKIVEFLYNNETMKFRNNPNRRAIIAGILSRMVKEKKVGVDKTGAKPKYYLL